MDKHKKASAKMCQHLADLMKQKKITQEYVADITGFSQSSISRMLSGRHSIRLDHFIAIADAIKICFYFKDNDTDIP